MTGLTRLRLADLPTRDADCINALALLTGLQVGPAGRGHSCCCAAAPSRLDMDSGPAGATAVARAQPGAQPGARWTPARTLPPTLQELSLSGSEVTDAGVAALSTLTNLTSLDLSLTHARCPPPLPALRRLAMIHCELDLQVGLAVVPCGAR